MQVFRQHEEDVCLAVNEVCEGQPSNQTVDVLKNLNRPLLCDTSEITRLYGRNFEVNVMNTDLLLDSPGQVKVFKADNLLLKVGAPVILIKISGKV